MSDGARRIFKYINHASIESNIALKSREKNQKKKKNQKKTLEIGRNEVYPLAFSIVNYSNFLACRLSAVFNLVESAL